MAKSFLKPEVPEKKRLRLPESMRAKKGFFKPEVTDEPLKERFKRHAKAFIKPRAKKA